jgi:hypothetical protein
VTEQERELEGGDGERGAQGGARDGVDHAPDQRLLLLVRLCVHIIHFHIYFYVELLQVVV